MSAVAVDAAGVRHAAAGSGARIVSLVPSITELLFALDLGAQVVGRTTFCIHPHEPLARVPRVGGTKTPRLERIAELAPSHVIVNVDENRREDAKALADAGVCVITTHPCAPQDNPALYRLLGEVFQRADRAAHLCNAFREALATLQQTVRGRPRRRVLYLIWRDPWMTVSRDTYIAGTLAEAGLDTAGHDPRRRYPELDLPHALAQRLDAVLLPSEPFPFKPGHVDEIREAAGDPSLPVHPIDGEMTSWYGSRAIAGCRYLARFAMDLAAR
jgi:ABC-type Fe3+-hydroxamate transport system substrate-binding protein